MSKILDKAKQNKTLFTPHKSDISYYSIECAEYDLLVSKLEEMEQKFEIGVKPYKYEHEKGEEYWIFCCGNDHQTLYPKDINKINYCPKCGTKIDWSNEE